MSVSEPKQTSTGRVIAMPSRVPYPAVFGFGALLCALQLLAGTDPLYAFLVYLFVTATGIAFNTLGGLTTTTGFSLSMVALKIVLISQVAKVVFWQPADSYLEVPVTTILVLLVGIGSMLAGLLLAGDVRTRRAWLAPITDAKELRVGALVCLVIGTISAVVVLRAGLGTTTEGSAGGVVTLATVFVKALPFSIVFATAHTIVRTKGQRSFSPLVFVALAVSVSYALFQSTKQGVFETILYYFLACIAWRFSFRRAQVAAVLISILVGILLVWPMVQALKVASITSSSLSERLELFEEAVSDIKSVDDFLDARDDINELTSYERFEYYGRPVGWLERFSLIEQDDELVASTLDSGEMEWTTVGAALRTLLPTFVDPDKPTKDTGNILGQRIGFLAEEDDDTQVAFGLVAESFAAFTWLGVLIIPAIMMFLFARTIGRLSGTYAFNVWTVYLFGRLQHTFVEQSILAMVRELVIVPILLVTLSAVIRWRVRAGANAQSGLSRVGSS
jgi:hypothetical protein